MSMSNDTGDRLGMNELLLNFAKTKCIVFGGSNILVNATMRVSVEQVTKNKIKS